MESIVKKLFLIGTATLAIAVTLTSVSSYAESQFEDCTQSATCVPDIEAEDAPQNVGMSSTFKFSVKANTLELNGVAGAQVEVKNFDVNKGELRVGVTSNQPFQILLADASGNGDLIGDVTLSDGTTKPSITAISATTPAADLTGSNVWGIWKLDRDNAANAGYLGLSDVAHPKTFYKSGTGANFIPAASNGNISDFTTPDTSTGTEGITTDYSGNYVPIPFGVRIDATLTPATYSTTVKVTVTDGLDDNVIPADTSA